MRQTRPSRYPFEIEWAVLSNRGWLATRAEEVRSKLLEIARLRKFVKREPIHLAGDLSDGLFGIASGSVHVSLPRHDGVNCTVLRSGVGFWTGELGLFRRHVQLTSVCAAEPTRAIHLPGARLQRLLLEMPSLVDDVFDLIHENAGLMLRLLASFSEGKLDQRVAGRLVMELDARGDAEGWISLSQFELAEMLAVSQPTIQRCLQRLASRGLVRLGYSRVQVADRGALECDRFGGDEVVPVG